MKLYGTVLEVRLITFKAKPSVRTATRYIQIRMNESNPVPNYIRISGHWAVFDYPGVRRVCRSCRQEGHIGADCTTPFCERCRIYVHLTEPCEFHCRSCGESRTTSRCLAPRTYSAVAGGSQAGNKKPTGNNAGFTPLNSSPMESSRETPNATAIETPKQAEHPKNVNTPIAPTEKPHGKVSKTNR